MPVASSASAMAELPILKMLLGMHLAHVRAQTPRPPTSAAPPLLHQAFPDTRQRSQGWRVPLQPSAVQPGMLRASEIHLLLQHQGCAPQLFYLGSKALCSSGALGQWGMEPGYNGMEPGRITRPSPRDIPRFECRIAKLFIKTQKRALGKAGPSDELRASS